MEHCIASEAPALDRHPGKANGVFAVSPRLRLAFLTNVIPPYRVATFERLARRVSELRVMVSADTEPNRDWKGQQLNLPVQKQRVWTLRAVWKHPRGFSEPLYLHIPWSTPLDLSAFQAEAVISVEMGIRTLLAACYRILNPRSVLLIWADVSESTESGRGLLRAVLRRIVSRYADLFITNGHSGKRYLETLGIAENRIQIVPYATDFGQPACPPPARYRGTERQLLYIGQLIERKGILQFLNVLAQWAGRNPAEKLKLVIVGDGPLRAEIDRLILPENLRLETAGSVAYENTRRFYAEAEMFVFPSLADTWGLVVNEAMASGLPVLGSVHSQAVDELVVDGENGWRFSPDSTEEVFQAVDRALRVPAAELQAMGQAAALRASALTADFTADLVYKAVNEAIQTKRRPRVALLTNMVAPYRVAVYRRLSETVNLRIFTAGRENNRTGWGEGIDRLSVKRSWGVTIRKRILRNDEVYDLSYLQLTPGYLLDLFRLKPDAIITNEMGLRTWLGLFYGFLYRVPVWVWWGGTKHTERTRGLFRRTIRALTVRVVSRWISYGTTSTEYLESIGVRRKDVLQIQNCISEAEYESLNPSLPRGRTPQTRFLFVGQLIARKGIRELLLAFAELSKTHPNVSLTIVGEGPEKASLDAMIAAVGIDNIHFTGAQTSARTKEMYKGVDCLVFPTLEDVWGLVVNEAIWAGVPVLCSQYAGCAPEIVLPECVFNPSDHWEFVRMLTRAAKDGIPLSPKQQLRTAHAVAEQISEDILSSCSS